MKELREKQHQVDNPRGKDLGKKVKMRPRGKDTDAGMKNESRRQHRWKEEEK
jgi:hypothetical protein